MSLDTLPNEILLQIFKHLYPPGAFECWVTYDLKNETLFPPRSFLPPGWKPAISEEYTEFNRTRHYLRAIYVADLAMRRIAGMNHHLCELSGDILVLRFKDKTVTLYTSDVPPEEETWEMLVQIMRHRDGFLDRTLKRIVLRTSAMETVDFHSTSSV